MNDTEIGRDMRFTEEANHVKSIGEACRLTERETFALSEAVTEAMRLSMALRVVPLRMVDGTIVEHSVDGPIRDWWKCPWGEDADDPSFHYLLTIRIRNLFLDRCGHLVECFQDEVSIMGVVGQEVARLLKDAEVEGGRKFSDVEREAETAYALSLCGVV